MTKMITTVIRNSALLLNQAISFKVVHLIKKLFLSITASVSINELMVLKTVAASIFYVHFYVAVLDINK
jgi:hypothetical protein